MFIDSPFKCFAGNGKVTLVNSPNAADVERRSIVERSVNLKRGVMDIGSGAVRGKKGMIWEKVLRRITDTITDREILRRWELRLKELKLRRRRRE